MGEFLVGFNVENGLFAICIQYVIYSKPYNFRRKILSLVCSWKKGIIMVKVLSFQAISIDSIDSNRYHSIQKFPDNFDTFRVRKKIQLIEKLYFQIRSVPDVHLYLSDLGRVSDHLNQKSGISNLDQCVPKSARRNGYGMAVTCIILCRSNI